METIYIIVGAIIGFLAFLFIVFQAISYKIMSGSKIDDEQKIKCAEAIKKGESPSKKCEQYIKKGLCPDDSCGLRAK